MNKLEFAWNMMTPELKKKAMFGFSSAILLICLAFFLGFYIGFGYSQNEMTQCLWWEGQNLTDILKWV